MNVHLRYMPKKWKFIKTGFTGMECSKIDNTGRDTDIFFSVGKTEQSWDFSLESLIHICFLSMNWHIISVIQRQMNIIHCGQGLITFLSDFLYAI